MRIFFMISLLVLGLTSCKNLDDLFRSYGEEVTETRWPGAFNSIVAGEKFDILLVQDTLKDGMVEITAGKNVIDGYTTSVHNGELRIANDNKFNWVRKLKIRQKVVVYFKTLDRIQIKGSARFSCRDSIRNLNEFVLDHGGLEDADMHILGDYVYVHGSNTGGVNLKGKCFLLSASVDDISFIHAMDMTAEKCYISSFSLDNSYVNGTHELDINLYGNGNIYYRTVPLNVLKIQDTGDGEVLLY